ncbi:cobalamin B12-binding domain-containing protein [Tabrizicola sp. BL-A-41-H6]|uniref:cobalamin B12-binding domain-containing protein n=1 Tax=Tabrizicola sp. BL-A-41-H6 TaxID=3421107 RepID=UPI003D67CAA7
MSDESELVRGEMEHPVARARTVLERRGADLPEVALKALAREVILRIAKKPVKLGEPNGLCPDDAAIAALCDALVSPDEQIAPVLVRAARLAGMSADTLYFGFIAKAVALLGTRWERDELTVSDVIIGAGRVYGILRELRTVFLAERMPHAPGATAVFAQVPGEIHTIGVTMAADALRRKGWEIDLRLGLNHDALVSEIGRMQPTMVGLSASTRQQTFALARLIVALRVCCPQVWILVAGQIVAQDSHLRDLVDADAVAATLDEATAALGEHLDELAEMSQRRG